jgi:hypothetical protein
VQVSFETAEYTANADALGALRLLEAIRILGLEGSVRFYQASTSEIYGKVQEIPPRLLSAFALRGGQALCLLDHAQEKSAQFAALKLLKLGAQVRSHQAARTRANSKWLICICGGPSTPLSGLRRRPRAPHPCH